MRLAGKVAVVTGGGIGIGRKTALLLAKEGVKVAVTDIDEKNGQATVKEILALEGEAIFVSHDVTEQSEWNRVLQEVLQTYRRIDMLFNNAGLYQLQCMDQHEGKYEVIKAIWQEIKQINSSTNMPIIRKVGIPENWDTTDSTLKSDTFPM